MKDLLQKTHLRALMLVVLMLCGVGTTWGESVTYTISSKNTLTTTGTAPSNSSATIVETYGTSRQMTKGNSQTLTLNGFIGYKITNITLSMKSNSSGGSGYLEYTDGSSTYTTIVSPAQFKSDSWYGNWSTSYVDISKDVNLEPTSNDFKIRLGATANSLYCQSYTLTYEKLNSAEVTTTTTINATGITNTDVYTSTAAGQLTASVTTNGNAISGATVTWSGNNDDVATISRNGTVTLVAPGTVTFTASYAGVDGEYASSSATYEMTVTSSAPYVQPTDLEVSLNNSFFNCTAFSSWNSSYGTSFTGNKDNVSVVYDKADSQNAYIQTSGIRMYAGNTLTFIAPEGYNLVKIEFAGETGFATNLAAEGLSNGTWTGVATEVTISGNSNKKNITNATITLAKVSSVRTPVISLASGSYFEAQSVTISCETDGATIYYTFDGTEPTSASTPYNGAITISETTTLKAIAVKGDDVSATAKATYTVVITEGKGIEANPFTVADANSILSANITPEKVYIKGIVSQIDDINTTQYYNATYYISDDGSTDYQFYVYRGKNIGNTNFTSEEQLQKGDEVVVYGDLTVYGSDKVFEFKQGNYIVSLNRPEPVELAAPIIFHDGGEYEGALKVAMAGQGTIKYTLNGGAEQTYSAPINVSETTTITAWTESNGVKSDEVSKTFTIAAATAGPSVEDNYYTIKNNGNNKYVNVAGRKTVTFVDETATAAGTVIRVKADDKGQVQILRSQGVDIPGYAEKAMNYVPKIVELIVDKLHAEGSGELLGENGLDAIMAKFKESFDYHLYLEEANGGYRIYGRTPSMQPVVDFYAENKANVDAKLPMLEGFINSAIEKVLQKTNGSGASILVPFSLQTVWEKMGSTLTKPEDEASTAKFYEEVLSSEANVWNFAYETAMIYWSKLKEHPKFQDNLDKLGDYAKYIDKVENIRPNFKYYIVQKNDQLDFISQGNSELNADFTTWTLAERTDFSVAFNEDNLLNGKYYTTLYTDFAYTLPGGVKAYKVTDIEESGCFGYAVIEEVGSQNIAAQTPVLLMSESAETQALTLSESGTAVTDNLLVGPDYLINTYKITAAQVESLFDMAKAFLGEDGYNNYLKEYEHLMLRTAGTVNNKYFYGLSKDDCKNLDENVCLLGNSEEAGIGFANDWQTMNINQAFLVSDIYTAIRLSKVGDVNRDGLITIADVPALVNIILEKVKYPDDAENYDFGAADVNCDGNITITDVTSLVNIILNQ